MDFVKKFAQEQLEKQLGGDNNNNNNQQQQHSNQGQSQGYGGQQQQSSNFGGFNENQQGSGYSDQQSYGGQGQQQYGQEQGSFGGQGQGQGYGGQGGQGGGFGVTGGSQYNAPHGSGGASSFQGGGGGLPNINQNEALQAANQHAGNGNENASMFSQAFSFISNMNKDDDDVDEQDVQKKHEEVYNKGQGGNMSANAIGSAAALQAIKAFTSGGSDAAKTQDKGGNDMVSKIIGMAISEAAKMFDKSGGAATGNKQDAVNSAGQTVMKLLLKNQVSGMMGGGQSGGLSSLMGMASKFM